MKKVVIGLSNHSGFDCSKCMTKCCHHKSLELIISEEIGKKIEEHFPHVRPFMMKEPQHYRLIRSMRCPLLQDDGLCAVETKLGRNSKPYACRLFPFIFFELDSYLLVRTFLCNNWQWYMSQNYELNIEDHITLYNEIKQKGLLDVIAPHETYLENTLTDDRITQEIATVFYDKKDKKLINLAFEEDKLDLANNYDKTVRFVQDFLIQKFGISEDIRRLELEQYTEKELEIVEGYLEAVLKYVSFMPNMIATNFEDSIKIRNFILIMGAYRFLAALKVEQDIGLPNPRLNDIAWELLFDLNSPLLKHIVKEIKKHYEIIETSELILEFEKNQIVEIIKKIFTKK